MVGSKEAGVSRVMSLGISSSVYPTASFAAIFAMGKPVAFEASAEDRETQRVELRDRADDHHVVVQVPHHLELELLPSDDRLLDEDGPFRGGVQGPAHGVLVLFPVVGYPCARPPEREGGPDDGGISDRRYDSERLVEGTDVPGERDDETQLLHRLPEEVPVFGLLDGLEIGPDELHTVFLAHAHLVQRDGDIA